MPFLLIWKNCSKGSFQKNVNVLRAKVGTDVRDESFSLAKIFFAYQITSKTQLPHTSQTLFRDEV